MDSPSARTTVREIACALYLKRELAIILPTGERQMVVRPATKHMVYQQLQCIYRESAPSRSTAFRWLKQLEETQPALVAYARGSQIAIGANRVPKVDEAPSKSLQEHRKDQARFIAEIRAQYDRLAHSLDSLDGQVVLDRSTGKFILQKEIREVTMSDNEQAWSAMIPCRRRPQRLYVDNGKAFSAPSATSDAEQIFESSTAGSRVLFPWGKIERVFPSPIDRSSLGGLNGYTKSDE